MLKEKFEYFYIYGDVTDLPVALIHKENVKDKDHAQELATKILAERGIHNPRLVEMSEDPIMAKKGGCEVQFLYYDYSRIDIQWVNENMPAVVFYADKDGEGTGFTFMDEKVADDFMRKVTEAYLIFKKRIK